MRRPASLTDASQRLWPAGEGMAEGLILGYQKSAPSHSLPGDKWRCEPTSCQIQNPRPLCIQMRSWNAPSQQKTLRLSHPARAKQSAEGFPAVEAGLSSAADCGKRAGDCLSEASSSQPPQTASSARNRAAALPSARLFFGYLLLAKQKKVTRLPGRDPACRRPTASKAFLPTPQRKTP